MGNVNIFKTRHRSRGTIERLGICGWGVSGRAVEKAVAGRKQILVFEARKLPANGKQPMGRVAEETVNGIPVLTGASWEHTPDRDSELHKQSAVFNAEISPDILSEIDVYEGRKRVRTERYYAGFDQADQRINDYRGNGATLKSLLTSTALGYMGAFFRISFGDSDAGLGLGKVSAAACRYEHATNAGNFHMRGFYNVMLDLFSETHPNTEVLYDTPICEIHNYGDYFKIVTTAGKEYYFEHFVLSVSVGVIKSGQIKFFPELSPEYLKAFDGLDMGIVEKIYMAPGQGFFIKNGIPHNKQINLLHNTERPIFAVANPAGKPVTMVLTGGKTTLEFSEMDDRELQEYMINRFREAFPDFRMEGFLRTRHHEDPYSLGSYPLEKPGYHGVRKIFNYPIGRFWFVGDNIHDPFAGQVPASFKSGTRVGRIIAGDDVDYDRTPEETKAREIERKLTHREKLAARKSFANGFSAYIR